MIQYRTDIDGLRAVAVLLVVIFHAFESMLPGGFIGVDVFFVISGFLITSIITKEVQANRFSLLDFWERRARRILPALFFMLFFVSIIALVFLIPPDLSDYGEGLLFTSLFAANFWLAQEGDYFDEAFLDNPLTHVWSLAVEEQFYLIWPLFLLLLLRKAHRFALHVALCLLLVSLGVSEWLIDRAPQVAFFHLPSRAFELLTGACLALSREGRLRRPWADVGVLGGLALVLLLALQLDETARFPGLNALIACTAAALIIRCGSSSGLATDLLGNRVATGIGKISYSWYLWHWPPLAFSRYALDRPLEVHETLACLALGLAAAVFSYRFVELPFRKRDEYGERRRLVLGAGALTGTALLTAGVIFQYAQGFPQRLALPANPPSPSFPTGTPANCVFTRDDAIRRAGCSFGRPEKPPRVLIWGDSHAWHFLPALSRIVSRLDVETVAHSSAGCPPVLNVRLWREVRKGRSRCADFNEEVFARLSNAPSIEVVILGGRWARYLGTTLSLDRDIDYYLEGDRTVPSQDAAQIFERRMTETVERILALGKRVVILDQVPEFERDVGTCAMKAAYLGREIGNCGVIPKDRVTDYRASSSSLFRKLSNRVANVTVFDPIVHLCDASTCHAFRQGSALYSDSDHINEHGALFLEPHLRQHLYPLLLPPEKRS